MSRFIPHRYARSAATWVLGTALLLLAGFGIYQAKALEEGLADHELRLTEKHLERLVVQLEEYAGGRATNLLRDLAALKSLDSIGDREDSLRKSNPEFDTFYIWDAGDAEHFIYPRPARSPTEVHQLANLCLNRTPAFTSSLSGAASALNVRACLEEEPALALRAALQTGEMLLLAGRPREAVQALTNSGFRLNTPFGPQHSRLPSTDIAAGRFLAAQAMYAQGDRKAAQDQVSTLLNDIQSQSGSTLLHLMEYLQQQLIPKLDKWEDSSIKTHAKHTLLLSRQRLAGFAAMRLHMESTAPLLREDPKMIYGSPGEDPYLIYFSRIGDKKLHGAVQFNQKALLQKMLAEAGDDSVSLVIRDARGTPLVEQNSDEGVIAEVPFQRFLPHLRLASVSLFDSQGTPSYRSHFIWQILPILIAGLLGILAMLIQYTADRQERDLRNRQQEFATRVTHELKTPLAGIRLMAENLELGAVEDHQTAQEFAQRIVGESDRLSQRVDEILQAARQPTRGEITAVDLEDLLLDLVEEWEPRFDSAGLILHTEIGRSAPIRGDLALIRDAISNLLDNALKYHDPNCAEPQATVKLFQDGKQAVIEVEDNGIGVPKSKRKVIFERFSRVEGPGRGKAGGHGLGLAFAREAIDLHNGQIECRNGTEGGTCFTVRIPVSTRK